MSNNNSSNITTTTTATTNNNNNNNKNNKQQKRQQHRKSKLKINEFRRATDFCFLFLLGFFLLVASLPGIVGGSIGLPDAHSGYGFAIGNVAAFDMNNPDAIVSPGQLKQ